MPRLHLTRSRPGSPRPRARLLTPLVVLLAATLVLVSPGADPGLRLVRDGDLPGTAIDPWPSYDPQKTCQPAAKAGTLKLAAWLQKRFPGSGSSGISRSCGSGGTSEHKEGRAFDWRLDVDSARDRRYAEEFIAMISATDGAGNEGALGRRMGIMYVIWNDRMYAGYRKYEPRAYLSSGCRTKASCSKSLRHRDHVHISLTWRGARALSSWYAGSTTPSTPSTPAKPLPVLDLGRRPVTKVVVPAGGRVSTPVQLRRGRTYKVAAWGVTRLGDDPSRVADPACSWVDNVGWRRVLPAAQQATYGDTDLRMNGRRILAENCHGDKHVYTTRIRPGRTAAVTFALPRRVAAAGSLTVAITGPRFPIRRRVPAAPRMVPAPVRVPAPGPGPALVAETLQVGGGASVWTAGALRAGTDYRVTVSGTARVSDVLVTDGVCGTVLGSPSAAEGSWWRRTSQEPYFPGADHGNLFLDGRRFLAPGPEGDPGGCVTHEHTGTLRATTNGRLHLRLWDPTPAAGDDVGALTVTVERVSALATRATPPAAAATPSAKPSAKPSAQPAPASPDPSVEPSGEPDASAEPDPEPSPEPEPSPGGPTPSVARQETAVEAS